MTEQLIKITILKAEVANYWYKYYWVNGFLPTEISKQISGDKVDGIMREKRNRLTNITLKELKELKSKLPVVSISTLKLGEVIE